jgi:hypothetical protein
MKISPQATKGHLVVGVVLIILSLLSMIAIMFTMSKTLIFLIFFFGVWGGVETGRYLEFSLKNNSMPTDDQSNG